jgi:hypothetical protein
MAQRTCELKERLEINARKAIAYEKGQETTLPEPDARKGALEGVESAALNLRKHVANCEICREESQGWG